MDVKVVNGLSVPLLDDTRESLGCRNQPVTEIVFLFDFYLLLL